MTGTWRKVRAAAADGVKPIGFFEYVAGKAAGALVLWTGARALKRGDNAAFNHAMLATWAGNNTGIPARVAETLSPQQLNKALASGQVTLSVSGPPQP